MSNFKFYGSHLIPFSLTLLNLFLAKKGASFSPAISTNIGISPKNLLTF